jgi:hypothetical protein
LLQCGNMGKAIKIAVIFLSLPFFYFSSFYIRDFFITNFNNKFCKSWPPR